jgi:anthranilate synthase component 2
VHVVIVDNYDSFTFNLYQQVGVLTGRAPTVVRNDEVDLAGLRALAPTHAIVSPGPGSPERARDFGVSREVVATLSAEIPTLGVCLGHQGLVLHHGGRVVRAPRPVHGQTSRIRVDVGSTLFQGLAPELEVMRYHSLVAERACLPACLRATAHTLDDDALLMAVEHVSRPLFGVQFHPESVGTPEGEVILRNFLRVPSRGRA